MRATTPRLSWWHIAVFALVVTACLGGLIVLAVGWLVQIACTILLVLLFVAAIRRTRST